jgi:hypothetical protein
MIGRTPREEELAARIPPGVPSARIGYGISHRAGLYGTPAALPVTRRGEIRIALGQLPSGRTAELTVTSLEWLDDLESAIQAARAAAVVQGGMTLGSVMP